MPTSCLSRKRPLPGKKIHHLRIKEVFRLTNAVTQHVGCVADQDVDFSLGDSPGTTAIRPDPVNRAARDRIAGGQRILPSTRARMLGQERGVDAKDPVRKSPEQILTRGATEVEEQHEFDVLVLQGIDDVVLAGRFENAWHFPRIDVFGLNAVRPADLQNAGLAHIGDHHFDFRRQKAVVDGAEDHVEVGPRARAEDADAQFVARAQVPYTLSNTAVVERPGTKGRMRISAPAFSKAARSSGSSESGV